MGIVVMTAELAQWREPKVKDTPELRALERISVLVKADGNWDESYARKLGQHARHSANFCDEEFQQGLELILLSCGYQAAIDGWLDKTGGNHIGSSADRGSINSIRPIV